MFMCTYAPNFKFFVLCDNILLYKIILCDINFSVGCFKYTIYE